MKGLDAGKQDGFYVRINEDKAVTPVESITRERAEEILTMTRNTIEFHGALNRLCRDELNSGYPDPGSERTF